MRVQAKGSENTMKTHDRHGRECKRNVWREPNGRVHMGTHNKHKTQGKCTQCQMQAEHMGSTNGYAKSDAPLPKCNQL